jgi:hypothetical protein
MEKMEFHRFHGAGANGSERFTNLQSSVLLTFSVRGRKMAVRKTSMSNQTYRKGLALTLTSCVILGSMSGAICLHPQS